MGRYTGPKGRINRRIGAIVFENAGAVKALENRDSPPGQHTRRRKLSVYGTALVEKQKIKFYYGLRQKVLRKYFDKARRLKGNTGEQLLILCERRLDNVIRRAGYCKTRPQARQGIAHGHFLVNGIKMDRASYLVKAGDVITVNYQGSLLDGTIFDSSWNRGQPFTTAIGVGQVIQGWDLGMVGMAEGGRRILLVPSALAYGSQGAGGSIGPDTPLVFVVDLLRVQG